MFSTGSCVLPFVSKMQKVLAPDPLEPTYINKFKTDLWKDLKTRFDSNLNRPLLAKASFLDKRFYQLKFLGEEEKKEVIAELLEELKELEDKKDKEGNPEPPPTKKSRFLGRGLCESDDDDEEEKLAERELERYQAEARMKEGSDPFEWWRTRVLAYPLLSR